jgi:sulfoxide reductase heme-binding subunit YedZ
MSGITVSTAPWYASRATGVVALLLLTGVMVLGMLVNRQGRLPGLPGFAVTNLHRNVSLLAVAFVAIHVVTAVLDTYVSIPLVSAVIPFTSGYEGFWLGLGAISLDIMAALIITSLVRSYLSRRLWRAVHLLAYLSWPVAFAHSIGASRDLQRGPLLLLAVCCALAVVAAVIWRLAAAARELPRAERVGALMSGFGHRHGGPGRPRGEADRRHATGRAPRRGEGPRDPTAVS